MLKCHQSKLVESSAGSINAIKCEKNSSSDALLENENILNDDIATLERYLCRDEENVDKNVIATHLNQTRGQQQQYFRNSNQKSFKIDSSVKCETRTSIEALFESEDILNDDISCLEKYISQAEENSENIVADTDFNPKRSQQQQNFATPAQKLFKIDAKLPDMNESLEDAMLCKIQELEKSTMFSAPVSSMYSDENASTTKCFAALKGEHHKSSFVSKIRKRYD